MEVKLIVASGKHAGQEIAITTPKFFIGRAEDCQLRPRSDLVSRHHCVILVEKDFAAIRDFGSKNGTYVNDQRVKSEQELSNGDRLKVGSLEFQVHIPVGLGGKKKPKVHSVQEAAARTAESSAPPSENDVDLSDWFGDEEEESTPAGYTETETLTAAHTEVVGSKDGEASARGEASEEKTDKTGGKSETAGSSKEAKKLPTAASSYDAAAAALKKLRR